MGIVFMEGFDHYGAVADVIAKWSDGTASGGITFPAPGQGGAGKALSLAYSGSQHTLRRRFHPTNNYPTVIIGFWLKIASTFNHTFDRTIFYYDDDVAFIGSLNHSATGELQACRGTGGTTVVGSGGQLSIDTWHHIECKITVHNTSGVFIVKLDGVEVINFSGDTTSGSNNYASGIRFYSVNNGAASAVVKSIDHLFVLDTSGSVNNDFLGQCSVKALHPSGAGASTQWTPNSGTNHEAVDEIGQDGDTSYVAAATAGHKDLYAFGDLGATEDPLAVEVFAVTKKDDGTARTFATTMRSNATDADGATYTQTTSYDYVEQYRDTDPDTSAAWTNAGVNALQAGVKVVS